MKRIILGILIFSQSISYAQKNENVTNASSLIENMGFEAELDNSIIKDKQAEVIGTTHTLTPEISYKLNKSTSAILNAEFEISNPEEEDTETSFNSMDFGFARKLNSPFPNSKLKIEGFTSFLMEEETRAKKGYDGSIYAVMELKQKLNESLTMKIKPTVYQFLRTNSNEGTKNRALKLEVNPIVSINEKMALELPLKLSKTYTVGSERANPSKTQFVPTLIFALDKNFEIEFYDKMTMTKSGDDQFFADDILKKAIYGANLIYSM